MMITKKLLMMSVLVACSAGAASAQTLFSQDFAAGGTTATYVNASTPTTGQWNAITSSGAAKAWAISSNALTLTSTGGNAAYASRTTDFSPTPAGVMVKFDFTLTASATALTSAFDMAIGSGFGTANSSESNANTYAKFGINTTATNGFVVRDISGSTNGATTFAAGTYTFTWVANNTGSAFSYLAPDGTTETIANDTYDLWVGTSKQLNDRTVTTASQTITDWKFGAAGTQTTTAGFDNFVITTVPEPGTSAMLLGGVGAMFWMIRRKRTIKG